MSIILKKGLILTSDYNNLENKPAIDGVELTENTTKADLGLDTVYTFRGQVNTYNDLPKTGNHTGDTYNVKDTGENYSWDGSNWDCLSGSTTVYFDNNTMVSSGSAITVDADKNTLSNIKTTNFKSGTLQTTVRATASAKDTSIATEKAVRTELNKKQDNLVSGTNIKSINNTTLLGSGNIAVATTAQGAKADTAVQPSNVVTSTNGFEITDNNSNIALQIDSNGNLKTKRFDSNNICGVSYPVFDSNAFEISDESGNVALQIDNQGNLKTKNFDSSHISGNFVNTFGGKTGNITIDHNHMMIDNQLCYTQVKGHVNPIIANEFTLSCHRKLNEDIYTDNTMEGFEAGRLKGFKLFECDIRFTSDDVFVLYHDESIGGKQISQYTWDELHAAYSYIPKAETMLRWAKVHNVCVEFDCAGRMTAKMFPKLYDLIYSMRMLQNCEVTAYESELMYLVDTNRTDITAIVSFLATWPTKEIISNLSDKLRKFNLVFVSIDEDFLPDGTTLPADVHMMGFNCKSFTPTTKQRAQRLFNLGVDTMNVDATELWVLDY